MQSLIDHGEVYGEKKLTELLGYATRDLVPAPGYKLSMDGIMPNALTHKELEAFFGATLDEERGAHMELGFDEKTQQMVLEVLSHPLKGIDGIVKLMRTKTIGYIPIIEIRGAPYKPPQESMTYADGQHLLEGFGIQEIPEYDPMAYKQWRAELLARTRGWHLTEQLEIPLVATNTNAQSSTLVNEELVHHPDPNDPLSVEVLQKRSFTRSIVLFNEEDGSSNHIDFTLEGEDDLTRMYKQVYKRSNDPFANNGEDVTDSRLAVIKLTPNSYLDFSNALLEATHARNTGSIKTII